MISPLANAFTVLKMDAEDDREETTDAAKRGHVLGEDGKQKNKTKANGTSDGKSCREAQLLQEFRMPLVWIDLEMTGLNVEVDRILEIACIITDGRLTKSVEGPNLVIHQTKECLDGMGQWCQEHHAANGLTNRVLKSNITEKEAEKQVIEFVRKHVDLSSYAPPLAGNSVYVDFIFLKKYMPDLASLFHHVIVDVSSVKALCIRWFPKDQKKKPTKEGKHRALDDIRESIVQLKYYKENIFKGKSAK